MLINIISPAWALGGRTSLPGRLHKMQRRLYWWLAY